MNGVTASGERVVPSCKSEQPSGPAEGLSASADRTKRAIGENGALSGKRGDLKAYFKLVDDLSRYIVKSLSGFEGEVQSRQGEPPNPADLPVENNGAIGLQIRHVPDGRLIMLLTPLGTMPLIRGDISPKAIEALKNELKLESIHPDRQNPIFSVREVPGLVEKQLALARIKRKVPSVESIAKGLLVWNEVKPEKQ